MSRSKRVLKKLQRELKELEENSGDELSDSE